MQAKINKCFFMITLSVLIASRLYAAEAISPNVQVKPKSKLQTDFLKQDWGRDPFSLPEKKIETAVKAPLKLMGILTRGEKRIAIVNKSFVRAGEAIQGYVVSAIENDRIVLNKDGEETVLRIAEHAKKS